MIRVLVVDDSETVRRLLVQMLRMEGDFEVIGEACNGEAAVRLAGKLRPDVITMDVQMPVMDGLEATREIMGTCACPVVIVSDHLDQGDRLKVFGALQAGAVAVVNKPAGPGHPEYETTRLQLIRMVRMMSEVRVVTRHPRGTQSRPAGGVYEVGGAGSLSRGPGGSLLRGRCQRVLIGASTGGPAALQVLFAQLTSPFPVPILVVQHIAPGFLPGLLDWLTSGSGQRMVIAKDGALPAPGMIYFAPDDLHMGLSGDGRIVLSNAPKDHSLRPSVSHLFRTAAAAGARETIGILLTGMGVDGAMELKMLRDGGATTIIQDQESCVVFGMPGEAHRLGAGQHLLSPPQIADFLNRAASPS